MLDKFSITHIGDVIDVWYKPNNKVTMFPFRQENIILMQYTGLKDKNGKEIYEGDVVRFYGSGEGKSKVFWDNIYGEWAIFRDPEDHHTTCLGNYCRELSNLKCEVIGNIYENPELI